MSPTNWVERCLAAIVGLQVRKPGWVLAMAALTLVPALYLSSQLKLKTGFGELLPDTSPSVIEHRRVGERLAGQSTLAVTAESQDTALLKRFIEEVGPKIRTLPASWVSGVEDGPREVTQFFEKHRHLYAKLADVEKLHEDVLDRYEWEVSRQLGTNVDDEDEPPEFTTESIRQRFEGKIQEARDAAPGTDGYYIGEDGHFAVIMVRSPLAAMDQQAFDLQARVTELVKEGRYDAVDPQFRLGFAGSLVSSAEQYRAVAQDLTEVGTIGVALVLTVVYLFFLRLRVLAILGLSIALGLAWSFAFASVSIGYLNTASSFLISIVAGNGINAMIVYMARYMEARRDEGLTVPDALRTATLGTYEGTLTAAGVALAAYGALMLTEFRGFRHFGVIGAAGMFLCWCATYSVLPALLVLSERLRPFPAQRDFRDRLAGAYGKPFIWLAKRYPLPIALFGLVLGLGGAFLTVKYFSGSPMEYDLRKIRNDELSHSSGPLGARVNAVAGRLSQSGRAVLVERLDQVAPLVTELEKRRDTADPAHKPFGAVVSIYTLLPTDQPRKIELWGEIVDRVTRARDRGFVSAEMWKELQPNLPQAELKALGPDDLPEIAARPFTEKDETRGKIVYVAPTPGKSLYDADYLMLWANSFREIQLPNGDLIRGTGDAVIFADMLNYIERDAPRVAGVSFLGTVLVILLAFRGRRAGWVALGTLCLGVVCLIGVLELAHVKLNFLNFIALPIAIGVGSDYAVNVMKRRELEGDEGIERAFLETGGAVVACSMTTLCGYAGLLLSVNGAVRSLGFTAGVGELATQLSAMLVLPAALYVAARFRRPKPAS
jgi:uncharacterized protein